tara:strand:+ start:108 stop:941 length:834 start_codon:yes stop_codon:yes gene_type:complete
MQKIYKICLSFLIFGLIVSCAEEKEIYSDQDHERGPFYVEFVSCVKGNEFSKANLSNMMDAWRNLPIAKELRGSYLYDPLEEVNAFGPSMWWELEWQSKTSADLAWENWSENEEVMSWSETYQNVMLCDGEGRNAWDILIPVASSTFGEPNQSGYFYSQYWTCSYRDGAEKKDIENFLKLHSETILSSELEGTGYHYGVYFDRRSNEASHSDVQANFVWGEWALSQEAMEIQNENFTNNFQKVFEEFNKIGICQEEPDIFNSWMLYSQNNLDYAPNF